MNAAYKFRIYPTTEQGQWLSRNFGCCRFIYNQALDWRTLAYNADRTSLSYADTNLALTQVKKFYPWLKEADSAALQMSLRHLDRAFKNFFEGNAEYPSHKKKFSRQSYTTPFNGGSVSVGNGTVHLPKIGDIKADIHRRIRPGGKMRSATLSREPDGRYYVSLTYEYPETIKTSKVDKTKAIGLDMSMKHFYVDSNGGIADMPHFYRLMESKLAREQAKLSMMEKGSKNYNKQKRRIAKLHAKTKHQRSDFLHKLAYNLVMAYDVICIEDLSMKGMSRGLNLGKSVHDLGWGMFVSMLEYKCHKYGKALVRVDRFYASSKTCHMCGHINKELQLSDRLYVCPECGQFIDRDWNASLNILDEGLRIYRTEVSSAA